MMLAGKTLVVSIEAIKLSLSSDVAAIGKRIVTRSFTRCRNGDAPHSMGLKVGVQSVPFAMGQPKPGVDLGPDAIRNTGFIKNLEEIGVDVRDYGAIDFSHVDKAEGHIQFGNVILKNASHVGAANKLISESTAKIVRDGRLCLTLGGDHSIAIGTVSGVTEVHDDLAVLWVDAHSDMCFPAITTSGKFHGMPTGFLIKELEPYVMKIEQFAWLKPKLKVKNLAFIGLRDIEDAEREIIESFGIVAFSMKEVSTLGIQNVVKLALEKISPGGKRPLHLSFDIDALDDLEAKSTGTPVPGGLTLREGLTVVEQVKQAGNLVSMDLVEVNPLIGNKSDVERTTIAAKQIILNALGYYRGGISTKPLPKP